MELFFARWLPFKERGPVGKDVGLAGEAGQAVAIAGELLRGNFQPDFAFETGCPDAVNLAHPAHSQPRYSIRDFGQRRVLNLLAGGIAGEPEQFADSGMRVGLAVGGVGFEADVTGVSVALQRGDDSLPIDRFRAAGEDSLPFHLNISKAFHREERVAVGEGRFGVYGVAGIPVEAEPRRGDQLGERGHFAAG